MKKIELLAPAGDFKSLKAAVMAGCDAVYLGGNMFGARAFSHNFTNEELIEAIKYAHLYGVKVYVTTNTIIYEREVETFINYIEFLHKNNVDAVLIQDLGMLDLVRKIYPNLEVHSSTQMHIHNLDGVQEMEKIGVKRVVLARETSIDTIKEIKKSSSISLEVFVHGALCISYSGQCLMSSLIGHRSGNRGTCAGSCRLPYDIVDANNNKLNKDNYPISTKDLNSLEHIGELIDSGVDSLKIEGRMKSPEYVYIVVSLYREAIDNYYTFHKVYINDKKLYELKKIFNREFTEGFLFNTANNDLINPYRPNHQGVEIGKIINYKNNIATIMLSDNLSIGDGLRVISKDKDIGISVNQFYINKKLVKIAHKNDIITIKVNSPVNIDDKVIITLDKELNDTIDRQIDLNCRKVLIKGVLTAKINEKISLKIFDDKNEVIVYGDTVKKAVNHSISKQEISEKLNKLGNTVYNFSELLINKDNDVFINIKELNDLRRSAVLELNNKRLYNIIYKKEKYYINVPNFPKESNINILVEDKSQYNNIDRKKYNIIYSEEVIPNTILKLPRVIATYDNYINYDKPLLVGEIGAFNKLNNLYTDFSFNVVNSYTVAFLHSIGAKGVTLSYELTDIQIKNIIDNYEKRYQKHPNLELIIQGKEEVMVSKFSLNEYYKNNNIYLRDRFNNKYRIKEKNNVMYIYNYKERNNYNLKYYDMGINSLRINITK